MKHLRINQTEFLGFKNTMFWVFVGKDRICNFVLSITTKSNSMITLEDVALLLSSQQIENYKVHARDNGWASFRRMCEEIAEHCNDAKLGIDDANRLLKRMFDRHNIPW
jgi:hypothetical protein